MPKTPARNIPNIATNHTAFCMKAAKQWPNDCPRCAARMQFVFRPGATDIEHRTLRACACGFAIDACGSIVAQALPPALQQPIAA